ncbi:MAG: nonstructural protein [Microvirus sp.]|nr:MAG: nonstructural protein [Microvirus sp.]
MKILMYSIFDNASAIFNPPFFAMNDAVATRSFLRLCLDENSSIYHSPADYNLHCVGEFHDDTGSVISYTPRLVVTAVRVLAAYPTEKQIIQDNLVERCDDN